MLTAALCFRSCCSVVHKDFFDTVRVALKGPSQLADLLKQCDKLKINVRVLDNSNVAVRWMPTVYCVRNLCIVCPLCIVCAICMLVCAARSRSAIHVLRYRVAGLNG